MSTILTAPPTPRLVLLDTSRRATDRTGFPSEIQFRYVPTNFSKDVSSAWASSNGMNRADPIIQFSHGEQDKFTFDMRLYTDHSQHFIEDDLDALERACKKDDELKRPPRWQFIWGDLVDETVVIQTIGGVRYDEIRNDGTIRGVTLSVTLLIYKTVDVALIAEDRPSDTFFAVAKSGEQWEDIALREYDDPMFGDLLRRANPKVLFPGDVPGTIVKLPKIQNLDITDVVPTSIPLRRDAAGLALRQKMYGLRTKGRESTVLKK